MKIRSNIIYVNSFNQLMQRLFFLHAEENAGNNNFHNEKIGLINFFRDLWKNILDKPKEIEYIINFVKRSPKGLIKTGPGNYIDNLNKFMQHLHFIFEEKKQGITVSIMKKRYHKLFLQNN